MVNNWSRVLGAVTMLTVGILVAGCDPKQIGSAGTSATEKPPPAAASTGSPANNVFVTLRSLTGLRQLTSLPVQVHIGQHTSVSDIKWKGWGATTATGLGTLHTVDCNPNCASGTPHDYPDAAISLSQIQTVDGRQQYTHYSINAPGADTTAYGLQDQPIEPGLGE